MIEIAKLQRDGMQARAAMCESAVADYGEHMTNGGPPLPPITVYTDGADYWLADGFHRVEAASRKGIAKLPAEILDGTRSDALWHAIGANKAHGLRRSNEDKRKAVKMALEERPEMSDRAIAAHVGVDHKTVASLRPSGGEIPHLKKPRTGKDGKKYPIPAEKPKRDFGPPPEISAKKLVTVDEIGRAVPEKLVPIWERRGEVSELMRSISDVRSRLRKAQDEGDLLFANLTFSNALAGLDNAFREIKAAKPHVLCSTCHGLRPQQCRLCNGVGFISKFKWETVVPEENRNFILKEVAK